MSPDCFKLGWPLHLDHDFFCTRPSTGRKTSKSRKSIINEEEKKNTPNEDEEMGATADEVQEPKWLGKTTFVEIRSFWHIFKGFDRMWSFLILSLQAMVIMASHDVDSPLQVFDTTILEDLMSIFITSAALKFIKAIVDMPSHGKPEAQWTLSKSEEMC